MREITIAGGGLAGLSLAVGLRLKGVPVTVLEAGSYPRHRVCGEFISGVSPETLSALGIGDCLADVRKHRTLAWLDRGLEIHRATLPTPALGISRHALDERLRRKLESTGGAIHCHHRAKPVPREGLVWAAGRRPRNGPWIGLKAHIKIPSMRADLEMHVGRNGYAGLAGVEDGWVNVCGLFRIDRTISAKGEDLLPAYLHAGGNTGLAEIIRNSEWRAGSFSAVAGFELGRQPPVPGLLCIGDAESMIPPFTGNGMSMAFQAAEHTLAPLHHWARGTATWNETANTVRHHLRKTFRRRLAVARALHGVLLDETGRALLQSLAGSHLLPFRPMLSLVR